MHNDKLTKETINKCKGKWYNNEKCLSGLVSRHKIKYVCIKLFLWPLFTSYFLKLSHIYDMSFKKQYTKWNECFWFSLQLLPETSLNQFRMISSKINVGLHVKYLLFWTTYKHVWVFSKDCVCVWPRQNVT